MQHHQMQMQLQQAQAFQAALAAATSFQQQQQQQQSMNAGMAYNMGYQDQKPDYRTWTNAFSNQQPAGQDSAYQRLPLNNRRRNLKRERPSDFLEVGGPGEQESKVPRYWE